MDSFKKRLHITYTKENLITGEVYSGRASGLVSDEDLNEGVARSILSKRDSSQHKNEDGFDRAQIDLYSQNSDAIRGREQELIEHFGGAKSEGGKSGNFLNSISRRNEKREQYLNAAKKIFGGLGFLFLISFIRYLL